MFEQTAILRDIQYASIMSSEISVLGRQFIEYGYGAAGHSKWTMTTRATHVKQFAEFCKLAGIRDVSKVNAIVMDTYFKHYAYSHSASTVNTAKRILKVFLSWVRDYKEINISLYPERIKSKNNKDNLPKCIKHESILRVINEVSDSDSLLIAFAYESGVRISELTSIEVKDMDFDTIKVIGKGNKARIVYISDRLAGKLRMYIAREGLHGFDPLFRNSRGNKLTSNTARARIQKGFSEVVGIEMYPHQLRHSFAVQKLLSGCDLVTIQRLLGHEDISTTQVYLRLTDQQVKENFKKYS